MCSVQDTVCFCNNWIFMTYHKHKILEYYPVVKIKFSSIILSDGKDKISLCLTTTKWEHIQGGVRGCDGFPYTCNKYITSLRPTLYKEWRYFEGINNYNTRVEEFASYTKKQHIP
jgi:hypothetical protein